ncbi:hypothetical protein BC831DRAFT_217720 [Entophlyctis helioformis]|nr:hypothetical protein BC831DRAFT_217720 [Entophlyctis helioformis]
MVGRCKHAHLHGSIDVFCGPLCVPACLPALPRRWAGCDIDALVWHTGSGRTTLGRLASGQAAMPTTATTATTTTATTTGGVRTSFIPSKPHRGDRYGRLPFPVSALVSFVVSAVLVVLAPRLPDCLCRLSKARQTPRHASLSEFRPRSSSSFDCAPLSAFPSLDMPPSLQTHRHMVDTAAAATGRTSAGRSSRRTAHRLSVAQLAADASLAFLCDICHTVARPDGVRGTTNALSRLAATLAICLWIRSIVTLHLRTVDGSSHQAAASEGNNPVSPRSACCLRRRSVRLAPPTLLNDTEAALVSVRHDHGIVSQCMLTVCHPIGGCRRSTGQGSRCHCQVDAVESLHCHPRCQQQTCCLEGIGRLPIDRHSFCHLTGWSATQSIGRPHDRRGALQ